MKFEWDENKNEENIAKHGLFFEDAPEVFEKPLLALPDTRFRYGEERWIGFGLLSDLIVAVVFVRRGNAIRIISLRPATYGERNGYKAFLQERFGKAEE